jgi:DNA (cytosine-5)-methyltransferase 1
LSSSENDITLVDLFSGIGMFHLGARRAGLIFANSFFSEIDSFRSAVYLKNFPESKPLGDVTKIDCLDLLDKKNIILTCGFPCKNISIANQSDNRGIYGSESRLWFNAFEIICRIRPRVILIENSAILIVRGFNRILTQIASLGYDAEWKIIRASEYGYPHERARLFVVAYTNGIRHQRLGEAGKDSSLFKQRRSGQINLPVGIKRFRPEIISRNLRNDYGYPSRLDRHRLASIGNSLIPDIAEDIFINIVENIL